MSLLVRRHADADAFLRRAGDWLLEREVEHTVLLGALERLRRGSVGLEPPFYLATVEDGGAVAGCALRTPPHPLSLTRMPEGAAPAVVADVAAAYPSLPGVHGPPEEASAVAHAWAALRGVGVREGMRQRLHRLTEVTPPGDRVAGHLRPARAVEVELLTAWFGRFEEDAGMPRANDAVRTAERVARGELDVWDDGGPVCMVGVAGRSPGGVRVGPVYTPAEHRGHGYATAAVAAFSQRLLDAGARFCCLHTDVANPTSNAIYARVGYRIVADVLLLRFEEDPR